MRSIAALPEHPFCNFVEQIYSEPGLKHGLLTLRQRLHINLNILLFCCWIGQSGRRQLCKKDLHHIVTLLSPWHEQIVLLLKKLRKRLQQPNINIRYYKLAKLVLEKERLANHMERLILVDAIIKPIYEREVSQCFSDACKNISVYCKELRVGMDQQDTEIIKQLLAQIFPTLNSQHFFAYWGSSFIGAKRDKTPKYSQLELEELI